MWHLVDQPFRWFSVRLRFSGSGPCKSKHPAALESKHVQTVLACGAGEANTAIAKRMGLIGITVGKWRKRFGS